MTNKTLEQYAAHREQSLTVRCFKSDKPRFDELQRRLVIASGGYAFSQGQVLNYLLDMADGIEAFVTQIPPPRPANHKNAVDPESGAKVTPEIAPGN